MSEPTLPSQTSVSLEVAFTTAHASDVPFLSAMGPLILAAAFIGIAGDTRKFARVFEQPHALVIREVVSLEEDLKLLETAQTSASTRVSYRLTSQAQALFDTGEPS